MVYLKYTVNAHSIFSRNGILIYDAEWCIYGGYGTLKKSTAKLENLYRVLCPWTSLFFLLHLHGGMTKYFLWKIKII